MIFWHIDCLDRLTVVGRLITELSRTLVQGWSVPRNLPLVLRATIRSVAAWLLVTVCLTAVASPIVANRKDEPTERYVGYGIGETGDSGAPADMKGDESSRLLGLGSEVEERTETLLTYFGIEPRLVLPGSQRDAVSAGMDIQSQESQEASNRTSVVPEPKEVLLLAVGAALLVGGGALRRWLARRP